MYSRKRPVGSIRRQPMSKRTFGSVLPSICSTTDYRTVTRDCSSRAAPRYRRHSNWSRASRKTLTLSWIGETSVSAGALTRRPLACHARPERGRSQGSVRKAPFARLKDACRSYVFSSLQAELEALNDGFGGGRVVRDDEHSDPTLLIKQNCGDPSQPVMTHRQRGRRRLTAGPGSQVRFPRSGSAGSRECSAARGGRRPATGC